MSDLRSHSPAASLCKCSFTPTLSHAVYAVVVCLSVCLSHVGVVAKRITSHHVNHATRSPVDSTLRMTKISAKFQGGSAPTRAPNKGGIDSKRRFSTNISLYLRNGAR